jgi:uncharacterized phage protein (TIGR01671 family)
MREIKFRAWDKIDKEMQQVTDIDFILNKAFTGNKIGERKYKHFPENIELMQFTGLYDKNGKEIYEGDIVEYFRYEYGIISQVLYSESLPGFFWEGYYSGEEYAPSDTTVVIGNIYENHELLK